jgi:hypothetical protein
MKNKNLYYLVLSLGLYFSCSPEILLCQVQKQITGQVLDEEGNGVPGVNVLVKGTLTGTVTDSNGAYCLSIQGKGEKLVFTWTGYASKEVKVKRLEAIDLILDEDGLEIARYWCCTNHGAPQGPHSSTNDEALRDTFGCSTFKRCTE